LLSAERRKWLGLAILATAQLMIVVDVSIVSIALPSAQRALGISNADRQWVVTAYTLTFGGLLILGGRIADSAGRRRVFVFAAIGFAAVSVLGGIAPDTGLLLAARALLGAFAALMAPASLSSVSVMFTDPRERARAFGIYGAIAGAGLSVGLLAGGLLTTYASWRWCFFVNAPVAFVVAVSGLLLLPEEPPQGGRGYDLPGAVLVTSGLVVLTYAVAHAQQVGWGSSHTLLLLLAAAAILGTFFLVEHRSAHPLLAVRLLSGRGRGAVLVICLMIEAGAFGTFFLLSYYFQGTLHYSPLRAGLALVPFSVCMVASSAFASAVLHRVGPRVLIRSGLSAAVVGMAWYTQIGVHTAWWLHVAVGEVVVSLGLGMVFVSLNASAMEGIAASDSGMMSAVYSSIQQIGGSLGVALLSSVAATVTASDGTDPSAAVAVVHGYDVSFGLSGGLLFVAFLTATLVLRRSRSVVHLPTERFDSAILVPSPPAKEEITRCP
jgi:EmrB/QacA subfamily drug resistance transporter